MLSEKMDTSFQVEDSCLLGSIYSPFDANMGSWLFIFCKVQVLDKYLRNGDFLCGMEGDCLKSTALFSKYGKSCS